MKGWKRRKQTGEPEKLRSGMAGVTVGAARGARRGPRGSRKAAIDVVDDWLERLCLLLRKQI
ncbi:hypothetical protein E2C01_070723 [Portunus trituberculatus]|uniref:Uncharacterized protein n=1 Tax=Portunus trituberculatus TaxID=210409 RepID=A0A5B7I238_PORTR|nr:hypothetical protein [Portunus trituberculatus]